jgi:Flp pilus assembly protein TadB
VRGHATRPPGNRAGRFSILAHAGKSNPEGSVKQISWLILMIAGVFVTAIGVALVGARGLAVIPLAMLAIGFLLSLAAVLRAREQRHP